MRHKAIKYDDSVKSYYAQPQRIIRVYCTRRVIRVQMIIINVYNKKISKVRAALTKFSALKKSLNAVFVCSVSKKINKCVINI